MFANVILRFVSLRSDATRIIRLLSSNDDSQLTFLFTNNENICHVRACFHMLWARVCTTAATYTHENGLNSVQRSSIQSRMSEMWCEERKMRELNNVNRTVIGGFSTCERAEPNFIQWTLCFPSTSAVFGWLKKISTNQRSILTRNFSTSLIFLSFWWCDAKPRRTCECLIPLVTQFFCDKFCNKSSFRRI